MTESNNRVALVTGGARGVGAALALELARRGYAVALLDAVSGRGATLPYSLPGPDDLTAVVNQIRASGARGLGVVADARDPAAVAAGLATVEGELGPVDVLITAAEVRSAIAGSEMSAAAWDEVVDTNLHGCYNVTRAVVPGMVRRGRGHVVAVVGNEARRGADGFSHVAAAAWGVIGLAKSIALEVAEHGVAVNVVTTGPLAGVVSDSVHSGDEEALSQRHPDRRPWVDPTDVAAAVTFLLDRPTTAFTGGVLDVSNGLIALNNA